MAGLTREQRAERDAAKAAQTAEIDAPRIAVLERRLQNPFGVPAAAVRLKDKTLFPRWFSSALMADRIWTAKENGWEGVKPEDVVDLNQIGGFGKSPDGWITRGERGQEVLMAMPKVYWDRLQLAKTKKNYELMRDNTKQSAQALEAAAEKLGPEVAERMEAVSRTMTIHDQYERIERTPEE